MPRRATVPALTGSQALYILRKNFAELLTARELRQPPGDGSAGARTARDFEVVSRLWDRAGATSTGLHHC